MIAVFACFYSEGGKFRNYTQYLRYRDLNHLYLEFNQMIGASFNNTFRLVHAGFQNHT